MEENKRFAQIIESKKVTKKFVANKWKVKDQYITTLTNGNKKIGIVPIKRIKELWPEVNLNWLLFGQGDMFLNSLEINNMVAEPSSEYGTKEVLKDAIALLNKELKQKNEQINRLLTIIESNNYIKQKPDNN